MNRMGFLGDMFFSLTPEKKVDNELNKKMVSPCLALIVWEQTNQQLKRKYLNENHILAM